MRRALARRWAAAQGLQTTFEAPDEDRPADPHPDLGRGTHAQADQDRLAYPDADSATPPPAFESGGIWASCSFVPKPGAEGPKPEGVIFRVSNNSGGAPAPFTTGDPLLPPSMAPSMSWL